MFSCYWLQQIFIRNLQHEALVWSSERLTARDRAESIGCWNFLVSEGAPLTAPTSSKKHRITANFISEKKKEKKRDVAGVVAKVEF